MKVLLFITTPFLFLPFAVVQQKQVNTSITFTQSKLNYASTSGASDTDVTEKPFHWALFFVAFTWGSVSGVIGISFIRFNGQSVMAVVRKHESKSSYGIQQLFAPIDYTISSFLTGVAIDLYAKILTLLSIMQCSIAFFPLE